MVEGALPDGGIDTGGRGGRARLVVDTGLPVQTIKRRQYRALLERADPRRPKVDRNASADAQLQIGVDDLPDRIDASGPKPDR